jgi:hypothetical protein
MDKRQFPLFRRKPESMPPRVRDGWTPAFECVKELDRQRIADSPLRPLGVERVFEAARSISSHAFAAMTGKD